MDNFLNTFDMDPILDKPFVPHQINLVGIIKFEDAFPDHVLKYFQIHYM